MKVKSVQSNRRTDWKFHLRHRDTCSKPSLKYIRYLEDGRNAHSGCRCLWELTTTAKATGRCCLSVSMAPGGFVERRRPKKQNAKLAPRLVECVVGQDADPVIDLSKWKV